MLLCFIYLFKVKMEKDFWHRRWEKNEIGFHEAQPNELLVKHCAQLGLSDDDRVFLPLCGKTTDIDWLLAQGYQVVGIELNQSAVEQLFDRLNITPDKTDINQDVSCYQSENLTIFQGDIFELGRNELGSVDAIYDRAALVALPDELRTQYARHLLTLCPKTPQLLIVFEYDQNQMDGPPFSVSVSDIEKIYQSHYTITQCQTRQVPGGVRQVPAQETAWLLSPRLNQ